MQRGPRQVDRAEFDRAYRKLVLENRLAEIPSYYRVYKSRYLRTLRLFVRQLAESPRPARILEIGGGQIAMLCQEMYGDEATVADLSEEFSESITRHGGRFLVCDLLRNDLPEGEPFDAAVLCEVVEHLPIPLHLVLRRLRRRLRPGAMLFVTTPNLYRLRNLVRLATGKPLFCNFFYPEPGRGIGHPFEFSREHLAWQLRTGGFEDVEVELHQLTLGASSAKARIGRVVTAPLLSRAMWRDSLVGWGRAGVNRLDPEGGSGAGLPKFGIRQDGSLVEREPEAAAAGTRR